MNIKLRAFAETDKGSFFALKRQLSLYPQLFNEQFCEALWTSFLLPGRLNYAIISQSSNEFLGFCAVHGVGEEKPELEIELTEKARGQGIGFAAMRCLLTILAKEQGIATCIARVFPDNYASQALFLKLGEPAGLVLDTIFTPESAATFQVENRELITPALEATAKLFEVPSEALLSHNLLFRVSTGEPTSVPATKPHEHLSYESKLERAREKYEVSKWLAVLLDKSDKYPEIKSIIDKFKEKPGNGADSSD